MKLITVFVTSLAAFSCLSLHATPDSAYANAVLLLTSSNSSELATANASVPVGYANANAVPGLLQNALLTSASSGGAASSYQNESVSGFSDKMTISDSALTGTPGSLVFHFTVTGTEGFSAASPATSSITASADFTGPSTIDDLSFTKYSDGSTAGTNFLGIPEMVTVPFVFGTPFTLTLNIDFTALVSGLSGSGSAMASGTFSTVASTDSVMSTVIGSPLAASSYTAKTASGANYFKTGGSPLLLPVPEPNEIYLALAGLAALPLLGRRFRSRRP
jgi:hypothetical protein